MATQSGDKGEAKAILEAFHQRLQEKGLKATRQRELIVRCFFELNKHISVDDLLAEVRKHRKSTGYATVYRTLKLLVELDFANERHFGDQPTLYDPLYGREEHFHLICQDCRRILEFEGVELKARHAEIASALGFALQDQRLELYASCRRPQCPERLALEQEPEI